jgi:hypothetical protein
VSCSAHVTSMYLQRSGPFSLRRAKMSAFECKADIDRINANVRL